MYTSCTKMPFLPLVGFSAVTLINTKDPWEQSKLIVVIVYVTVHENTWSTYPGISTQTGSDSGKNLRHVQRALVSFVTTLITAAKETKCAWALEDCVSSLDCPSPLPAKKNSYRIYSNKRPASNKRPPHLPSTPTQTQISDHPHPSPPKLIK